MPLKDSALKIAGRLLPYGYHPPGGVLFPYGHIVSDAAPPHVRNLYAVPGISKFRTDLEDLCRMSRPLQLAELDELPGSREKGTSRGGFLLSFDDGMREVYELIAPVLREKGLPAIFFLNSAMIDNKRLMWRHKISLLMDRSKEQPGRVPPQLAGCPGTSLPGKLNALRYEDEGLIDELAIFFEVDFEDYLRRQRPYLTSEQVQELEGWGFEIGAHSESHPYFCELDRAEQERQIAACVNFIRALGLPCRSFAFPFHDDGVSESLFRYMTERNLTLSFGTSEAKVDPIAFSFQRFAMDSGHASLSIRDLLAQLSGKALLRSVTGTDRIARN